MRFHRVRRVILFLTCSTDHLGSGKSQRPDPLNQVQLPLDVAIVTEMTRRLRAGTLAPLPAFNKILQVGHSLGSAILNGHIATAPTLTDAIAFTGVDIFMISLPSADWRRASSLMVL